MKPINEAAIVIPYYHSKLTEREKIALAQCVKVLGRYPIILLVPKHINKGYPEQDGINIEVVPDEWMCSVSAYNQMMLNAEFYERFRAYQYILIYQLDAFVFCDKLQEMCNLGYDYIGAPWLYGYFHYISVEKCIWRVGNGGFSLRRVSSFIHLLKKTNTVWQPNEDFFYAISDDKDFKVAPLNVALQFAFEREVKKCFRLNDGRIPFGCHAWEKYDFDFWRPYIEAQGYAADKITCHIQNEDESLGELYSKYQEISFFWEKIYSRDFLKNKLAELFLKTVDYYVIWGAGYRGGLLCRMLRDAWQPIKYIIDSDISLSGKSVEGYEIKNSIENDIADNVGIIIAIGKHGTEVAERLNQENYKYRRDYVMLEDIIPIIDIM